MTRVTSAALLGLACQACFGESERDQPQTAAGACNALERLDVHPTCLAPERIPAAVGGPIADGLYVLAQYSTPGCNIGSERTARITRTSGDGYELELVTDQIDGRASAVFVTSGTSITTTYVCGGPSEPEQLQYSVFDEADGYRLHVLDGQSALIFDRVAD